METVRKMDVYRILAQPWKTGTYFDLFSFILQQTKKMQTYQNAEVRSGGSFRTESAGGSSRKYHTGIERQDGSFRKYLIGIERHSGSICKYLLGIERHGGSFRKYLTGNEKKKQKH